MIEAAVFSVISGDAGVAALVGTRIEPIRLPQGATLPAVTYQRISEVRQGTFAPAQKMPGVLFQVDCWGATYSDSKGVAVAVRKALDEFKGPSAGETITASLLENEIDQYEPDVKIYRTMLEFRVWWLES